MNNPTGNFGSARGKGNQTCKKNDQEITCDITLLLIDITFKEKMAIH